MQGDSPALAFSPDGKLLAAAEIDPAGPLLPRPLRVWDVRTRTLTAFRGQSALGYGRVQPGRGADRRRGRSAGHRRPRRAARAASSSGSSRETSPTPSRSRRTVSCLFVGQYDGRGQLFSTETWEPVGRPLEGHTGRITSAEFSRDGRTLVTAAADGTAVLWDVETQKSLGSPLELAPSTFASVALSPDGARLFAVSTRGEGISFELSREAWKRHACLRRGPRAHRRRVGGRAACVAPSGRLLGRLTPVTGNDRRRERRVTGPRQRARRSTARGGRRLEGSGDALHTTHHRAGRRGRRRHARSTGRVRDADRPGRARRDPRSARRAAAAVLDRRVGRTRSTRSCGRPRRWRRSRSPTSRRRRAASTGCQPRSERSPRPACRS